MALEEMIIAWSKDRPNWQRDVMRRISTGDVLSEEDYNQLVDSIVLADVDPEVSFGLKHLPQTAVEDLPVRLLSIAEPKHVNALASDQPLTIEPRGLTIIYGDNGSGKSGYARLLKRITRSRHREDVLSDVFRDTALDNPTAILSVTIGDKVESLSWPETALPELQRMLFYDGACGSAYIDAESDFPYRPSALFVMDGLIKACVEVRTRIDIKLTENARSAAAIPVVTNEVKNTDAGRYLDQLSGVSSIDDLDELIRRFDESTETIEGLEKEEARFRGGDKRMERQNLIRQGEKLDALHKHLEQVHSALGDDSLTSLQERREELKALEDAASLLAVSLESEQPLSGVGSSSWKVLWQSARRFSEEHAYPSQTFPCAGVDSRCVLCQQALGVEGRERLSKFEEFVKDDTQVRLEKTRRLCNAQIASVTDLVVVPDAVMSSLKDLETSHTDLIAEVEELLCTYEKARKHAHDVLMGAEPLMLFGIEPAPTLTKLKQAAMSAREAAEEFSNPEMMRQRLEDVAARRQELELLQWIKGSRETIVKEIARLKEREKLEAAKIAAATGPITKKVLEFSEASITEVVRDTFTRETDRLKLERVTMSRTRAERGAVLHKPKLVGARQEVIVPRVFSEGERTALGVAAFFTEAQLEGSKSALILDDPVNSLDHIRRGLVATRLVELAKIRQVVLFTHDVAFVADLKLESSAKGVPVAERSVTRSWADERKPGKCSTKHPWKAKDVSERINELQQGMARIRRERGSWDDGKYEEEVALWAGKLSETWERIFSQEIVGPVLAEGGLQVRPMMVKILACFSDEDHRQFDASYSRISMWAKRHDKSALISYVAPDLDILEQEFNLVQSWFSRVKGYKK